MLSWKVLFEDFNSHKIIDYDIFKGGYWERTARELKTEFPDRKEWEDHFRTKLMSMYWARAEYEVVITSWPPFIEVNENQKLQDEVIEREKIWGSKPYRINITPTVARKIDIFEQLNMNWDIFIDYVWRNINVE